MQLQQTGLCAGAASPARPGPRGPRADSFQTFPLWLSQPVPSTHTSPPGEERGEARGLTRQFLKTKELDIWLLLVLLLPSSQLQNKPRPHRAPLLTPRPGERGQRRRRGREHEALEEADGADRAPRSPPDPRSQRQAEEGRPEPSAPSSADPTEGPAARGA